LFSRLWNSIDGLRAATATSFASAVVFAIVAGVALTYATREAVRKPVYVAILVNDDSRQPGAVVNAFADGRVEMITLTDINVPAGRALEIWTLWDRNVGPRSVGLIDRARTVQLNLDKLPPTGPDQLFEITLEPEGGSPIGRPTGPILYKGTTSRPL
jgi:anti-sigma-K factor RskA